MKHDDSSSKPPMPDCTECDGCSGGCGSGCGGGCSSGCGAGSGTDIDFNRGREPRAKIMATDWLDSISTSADFPAIQVQFKNTRMGFYSNPSKLQLNIGDIVAVEAQPGHDIGRVSMVGPLVRMQMRKHRVEPDAELKKVFRKATPADMERFDEARAREHPTMIRSRVIAEQLELNMKIGDVEFQGDGSKAIFYYIADERVDFRKLIRLLADEFHVRIEMKQIGARQEAGRIGGIGPCGRPLCCSTWMTHFVSVGTGAARTQDLSMNPQKLAGQCAKLKCCLNFEIDTYAEASRKLPPKEAVLETKDGDFYYFKADILQRLVTYSSDRKTPANLITIPAARAFEIIALNKQGVKVDALNGAESEVEQREYIDLTDQDSLTRFDRSRKKKKKTAELSGRRHDAPKKADQSRKTEQDRKTEQPTPGERKPAPPKGKAPKKGEGQRRPEKGGFRPQGSDPSDTNEKRPPKPRSQPSRPKTGAPQPKSGSKDQPPAKPQE